MSEVAARYRKDYVYNAQNRMIFSDVQDAFLNTRNLTEYAYDAFGRRIETIEYLGDHTRNLFDGFSFDIAEKTVLNRTAEFDVSVKTRTGSAAGAAAGATAAGAKRGTNGVANGTRYRYIGDEPLENAGSAGAGNAGANAGTTAAAKTRSRPNSEYVLYAYGEPVAVNADGAQSYFSTDILGSVRSVTDKYGNVKAQYEYDAFGSPYLSNIDSGMSFGYTGKIFDSDTGLYDYGFRDYSPNSARFTTVDPVRDGSNWFSYCMNDAVNYVDLFGLCGSDITFSSSVFNNPIIGNDLISNNWIVGDGWAIATSGATLNGLTQTTGVPWTTTSWDQSRNPTTLQIGETITWNTSLPFSNLTFSEGSTNTTSPAITAQSFSQSSSFASSGMNTGGHSSGSFASSPSSSSSTILPVDAVTQSIIQYSHQDWFDNQTDDYYMLLLEEPMSYDKFVKSTETDKLEYLKRMIVPPHSSNSLHGKTEEFDIAINVRTGKMRKAASGSKMTAYENDNGEIEYNLNWYYPPISADVVGSAFSLGRNAWRRYIQKRKDWNYFSKPGEYADIYHPENLPVDMSAELINYPYIYDALDMINALHGEN